MTAQKAKKKSKTIAAKYLLTAFIAASTALPAFSQDQAASSALPPEPASPSATAAPQRADYINNIYLAYIRTNDSRTNELSETGLGNLAQIMQRQTSSEPAGAKALDIENDELGYFPFIYWPVTAAATPLSSAAQTKLQRYINSGGMILFDIQDPQIAAAHTGRYEQALAPLLGNVRLNAMRNMPENHTLTRSFYLVDHLRGTRNNDSLRVESGTHRPDNMPAVIIGSNGWAAAWAGASLRGNRDAQEDALRAGVNIVMYALNGNYKDDPHHKPTLEYKRNIRNNR